MTNNIKNEKSGEPWNIGLGDLHLFFSPTLDKNMTQICFHVAYSHTLSAHCDLDKYSIVLVVTWSLRTRAHLAI